MELHKVLIEEGVSILLIKFDWHESSQGVENLVANFLNFKALYFSYFLIEIILLKENTNLGEQNTFYWINIENNSNSFAYMNDDQLNVIVYWAGGTGQSSMLFLIFWLATSRSIHLPETETAFIKGRKNKVKRSKSKRCSVVRRWWKVELCTGIVLRCLVIKVCYHHHDMQ